MRTDNNNKKFSPTSGPQWHSFWVQGRVEPNRKIYDYELVYFSNGHCKVMFESEMYECPAGTVVIIPPDLLHCTIATTHAERWCVHFDWFGDCPAHHSGQRIFVYSDGKESFDPARIAADPELTEIKFPFIRKNVSPEILPLLKRYFLCAEDRFEAHLERQGLLLQILAVTFRPKADAKTNTVNNRIFFAAKNLIDGNYLSPDIAIGEIAGGLKVSPNYLTKLFRKMLGMSAMDYINTRRLEHSCGLLKQTNMTVREVAFASGFNDANYFTRFFRKKYGETPGARRLREIKNEDPGEDIIIHHE